MKVNAQFDIVDSEEIDMTHTLEVEIDDAGQVHPVNPTTHLPLGRAILMWRTGDENECALMSEAALAVDWLRPEEDEAWAYIQPEK